MTLPKTVDLAALKTGGVIKQKEKDFFIIRLRTPVGKISADHFNKIADVSQKYGNGQIHLTVRQGLEIQGIPFDQIQSAREELEADGLRIGACGPRFRVVTACPGEAVCSNGLIDSAGLGLELDETYFGSPEGLDLPHKFKMTIAGCTSCCPKPQENDLGFHGQVEPELFVDDCNGCGVCEPTCKEGAIIMGEDDLPIRDESKCNYCADCIKSCPTDAWKVKRVGLAAYIGGRFGRHPELGQKLATFIKREQVIKLTSAVLRFYKEEGKHGERLGVTVNRIGLDEVKRRVL